MAKTYTFKRKAISGFIIQLASRRTDYPFVGYYGTDGSIVPLATAALPSVKALLTGEMANACAVEVTNKVIVAQ
jgi:hypothetical protein